MPNGRSWPLPLGMYGRRITSVPASASGALPVPRHWPAGARHTLPRHAIHPTGRILIQVAQHEGTRHSSTRKGPESGACRLSPCRLCPAGEWACASGPPVSGASVLCGLRPSVVLPHVRGFPTRGVRCVIRLPTGIRRAFPVTVLLRLPGTCSPSPLRFRQSLRVSPSRASIAVYRRRRFPRTGACGASQVLRRLSSGMPRPVDSGGPSHPRPRGCSCVAFGARSNPSASATSVFRSCTSPSGAHPYGLRDSLSTLRPSCSPWCPPGSAMDARLDTGGWLALTRQRLTLQDTPSFSWRDNAGAQLLPEAGARHERTLEAVSSRP